MELKYKDWGSLPIGKYFELKELRNSDSENIYIDIVALLCDVDVDDIMNLSISEVHRLAQESLWIRNGIRLGKRLKGITIEGKRYDIHTDFKKITAAQYIDFNTFYQDFERYYCNILTCFIIPEGKRYNDGYDAMELAEYFRQHMDIETAENACFFFARRSKHSIQKCLLGLIWKTGIMEILTRNQKLTELRERLMLQKETIDGLDLLTV